MRAVWRSASLAEATVCVYVCVCGGGGGGGGIWKSEKNYNNFGEGERGVRGNSGPYIIPYISLIALLDCGGAQIALSNRTLAGNQMSQVGPDGIFPSLSTLFSLYVLARDCTVKLASAGPVLRGVYPDANV